MDYFTVYAGEKPAVEFAVSVVGKDGGAEVTDLLGQKVFLKGRIASVGDGEVRLQAGN